MQDNFRKVLRKAKDATFRSLGHAAAALRLMARRSIRRRKGPSRPGTPPHTHTKRLPSAIVYAVDRPDQRAVIGPARSIAGTSGMPHEFGGRYKGQRYPRRPFMGPALEQVRDRLPRMWASSVR